MKDNHLGVSVIICCYNSSSRLPETIHHIAKQKEASTFPWELIIVDNASRDNTSETAQREWIKYGLNIQFKIVKEPQPGLSYARAKGIAEASYDYIIFCDDDNWLSDNYVSDVFRIFNDNPTVDIIGGIGIPEPEKTPPDWFNEFAPWYATGRQFKSNGIIKEPGLFYVYGASSAYRKPALTKLFAKGFKSILPGRTGTSLLSSEDVELCYALLLEGSDIYYSENLSFKHFIPSSRLTAEYFKRLNKGIGYSNVFLLFYKKVAEKEEVKIEPIKILLNNLKRLLLKRSASKNKSIDYEKYQILGTIDAVLRNYKKIKNLENTFFFKR